MSKIKEFWKKHKKVIIIVTSVAGGVLAGVLGHGIYTNIKSKNGVEVFMNDEVEEILHSVVKDYDRINLFTGIMKKSYTLNPHDLGVLGEKMVELGADEQNKFTHFIAIGPMKNN